MNIEVLAQQVRELHEVLGKQELALRHMGNLYGALEARMRQAEAALTAHKITNLGCGPTKRP